MTRSSTMDYGDSVLLGLGLTPEEFREEAKILIVVKLYEMGRLSTGAAAELADRSRCRSTAAKCQDSTL